MAAAAKFLDGFAKSGAGRIILRLVGDPDRLLETLEGTQADRDVFNLDDR